MESGYRRATFGEKKTLLEEGPLIEKLLVSKSVLHKQPELKEDTLLKAEPVLEECKYLQKEQSDKVNSC